MHHLDAMLMLMIHLFSGCVLCWQIPSRARFYISPKFLLLSILKPSCCFTNTHTHTHKNSWRVSVYVYAFCADEVKILTLNTEIIDFDSTGSLIIDSPRNQRGSSITYDERASLKWENNELGVSFTSGDRIFFRPKWSNVGTVAWLSKMCRAQGFQHKELPFPLAPGGTHYCWLVTLAKNRSVTPLEEERARIYIFKWFTFFP